MKFNKETASKVWLPKEANFSTCLDFLLQRFPRIPPQVWEQRCSEGKVFLHQSEAISPETPYQGGQHLYYFREVENEPRIPFQENILYENENFLIVDKPHFIPVHPAGQYVKESLSERLKKKTSNPELNAAHRIDRQTAGLVLFCKKNQTRGLYQELFSSKKIKKTYRAIVKIDPKKGIPQKPFFLTGHFQPSEEVWFLMKELQNEKSNAESQVTLIEKNKTQALVSLKPLSGKKHQLRIHCCRFSKGIVNDNFYPVLENEENNKDFTRPLQLLAYKLEFQDPVTLEDFCFTSRFKLKHDSF